MKTLNIEGIKLKLPITILGIKHTRIGSIIDLLDGNNKERRIVVSKYGLKMLIEKLNQLKRGGIIE